MSSPTPDNARPPAPDLSAVIPMHNAGEGVRQLIDDLLGADGLEVEVLAVDDASTDDTVAVLRAIDDPRVRVIELAENRGAGGARNVGFPEATGRYTLFFDADDEVEPAALATAVQRLDASKADLAFLPYRYRRGEEGSRLSMNHFDRAVWDQYVGSVDQRVVELPQVPRLLGFSNYPWNKVIRTDHYQQVGLKFGETRVHNDILGHWGTVLHARSILLLNQVVGTHIVEASGANLSHQHSRRHQDLFDALDSTYDLLESVPGARGRYAHHYWDFVLRVSAWAQSRVAPAQQEELSERLQAHILRMHLGDFQHMRKRRNPRLADTLARRALT